MELSNFPYCENDGYVGFWINGLVYSVDDTGVYPLGGRIYPKGDIASKVAKNASKSASTECDVTARYFRYSQPTTKMDYHLDGRRWYPLKDARFPDDRGNEIEQTDRNSITKVCQELAPFNNIEINLSSLICAQFGEEKRSWPELFSVLGKCDMHSDCYVCTSVGHKIAASLIKIAALRIFADPEQSILELPVNSMDAYNPESRIGKFGMGFFSFLYWLVGHPKRKLYIYSWFKDEEKGYCGYRATLRDTEDGLSLNLAILETSVTKTGSFIFLDASEDKFDDDQQHNFAKQMNKLKLTSGSALYYMNHTTKFRIPQTHLFAESQVWNNPGKDVKNVYVSTHVDYIFVEDYADGIPINVLLGSLFVPSISTKTIEKVVKIPKGWKANNYIEPTGQEFSGFCISVGGVIVYSGESPNAIVIDMPPTTRLPVSRDDIILDSETSAIFMDNLMDILERSMAHDMVAEVERKVEEYIRYTSSTANQTAARQVLGMFREKFSDYLVTNDIYHKIVGIYPKAILSITMNKPKVEARMIKDLKTNENVWFGKRVVTVASNIWPEINTYGFSSLVFVSKTYQKGDWATKGAQGYPNLKLAPHKTDYGKAKNELYSKYPIKNGGPVFEALWRTLMATYDGMSVYFNISQEVGKFGLMMGRLLTSKQLTVEEWCEIAYVLLSKLAGFKGNQTYGGSQYSLFVKTDTTVSERKYTDDNNYNAKLDKLYVDSSIASIESTLETDNTIVRIYDSIHPSRFAKSVETPIFVALVENAASVIDFSIVAGAFMYIKHIHSYYKERDIITKALSKPEASIFAVRILRKVQDLRYDYKTHLGYHQWVRYGVLSPSSLPMYVLRIMGEISQWCRMTTQMEVNIPYAVPNVKKGDWVSLKTSQLIGYLFSHEVETDSSGELDVMKTFEKVSEYEGSVGLQMSEIAINEGTTKDFVSASLTELTQNSVDAIRSNNAENREVRIYYSSVGKRFDIMVADFVGMPPNGFLHIGIPFLSTKTASELVTGEMGSGFFNVYRESSMVVIDTVYEGWRYISIDTPIKSSSGRVVDISRKISKAKAGKAAISGTRIYIQSNTLGIVEQAEYLGIAQYTSNKILGMISGFDNISIYANNNLNKIEKTHIATSGYFDIYFTDKGYPSYLFTKGIPFSPLDRYYSDYAEDVQIEVSHGIIINIRHGGYTPVQTRTRVNMPPEEKKKFEQILDFVVFVTLLQNIKNDLNRWNWIYDNINSRGSATQLMKIVRSRIEYPASNAYGYFMRTNFDRWEKDLSSEKTMAWYTNKLIEEVKSDDPTDPPVEKRIRNKINSFDLSPFPIVQKLAKDVLWKWISVKNKGQKKSGEKIEHRDVKPDEPDKELDAYFRLWLETYQDVAIKSDIKGWTKDTIKKILVTKSDENEFIFSGQYRRTGKIIEINTYTIEKTDRAAFKNFIKSVKSASDFNDLKGNSVWDDYFRYKFPCSTLPHEAEHARRAQNHDFSSHKPTHDALWKNDVPHERTFDQSANDVFGRVLAEGFYEELFKRYRAAKLL